METRGVLSEWDPVAGRMTCWGAAKVPFANRRILAQLLDLPEDAVEMIEGDAGGSFGVRGEFFPEDFLVPFAARLLGRPVKWIEDRREHLLAVSNARDVACELEIACDRDGRILAIRANEAVNIRPYARTSTRSEEHTSELQSLMRISSAVFCVKKKQINTRKDLKDRCQHH